jgi:integration host factor subunit alpha
MTLKKVDILEPVPSELGSPKKLFVVVTHPLLDRIASPLGSADARRVSIFGEFNLKSIKNRKGRNPAIGENAIQSPGRTVTHQPCGALRGKVNQKQ